jgi:hypothetical protein
LGREIRLKTLLAWNTIIKTGTDSRKLVGDIMGWVFAILKNIFPIQIDTFHLEDMSMRILLNELDVLSQICKGRDIDDVLYDRLVEKMLFIMSQLNLKRNERL